MSSELTAPDPHDVLVEKLEKRENVERLMAALGRMSRRERDVLLRSHVGQPTGTIARGLRISVAEAQEALTRAREKAGLPGH